MRSPVGPGNADGSDNVAAVSPSSTRVARYITWWTKYWGRACSAPSGFSCRPGRLNGNLYAYSVLDATALRDSARAHALPDHLNVLSPDRLESKPMPDVWHLRQRLGFDLRVRPVRRLRRDLDTPSGGAGKGAEIDAFLLEALRRYPSESGGMVEENRTREAVYFDWLAERLAPAATLDRSTSRLVRFCRVRVARGGSGPEGPDATVHGTMTVTDPAAFGQLLAHGVGRHRAYGYGMLLLRPPNRPAPEF